MYYQQQRQTLHAPVEVRWVVTEEQHKHTWSGGSRQRSRRSKLPGIVFSFSPIVELSLSPCLGSVRSKQIFWLILFLVYGVKEVRSVGGDRRDGVALALSASTQFCKLASIAVWFTNLTNLQIGFSFMMHRAHWIIGSGFGPEMSFQVPFFLNHVAWWRGTMEDVW